MHKTYINNTPLQQQEQKWYLIDAKDMVLGRLATKAASLLQGKHKTDFSPHQLGDRVIIINTDNLLVTGNKMAQKMYYTYTGFVGNMKTISLEHQMKKDSTVVIQKAIYGMLPKNILGREMRTMLKVYPKGFHPHTVNTISIT